MRAVSDEVQADDQAGAASGEAEPDRFDAVFEALPLMLFEVDDQDRLLWAKAGRATFLLPPEAFLNRRIREVMPPDVAERLVQGLRRAFATGEQVLVEYQLSGPGGTRSYCAHLVPRSPTRVATLVLDVTQQARADELLRVKDQAIESSLNAIALASLDGTLTYVNPAFVRLWGYAGAAEVVGRKAVEFWTDAVAAQRVMGRVLEHGESVVGELTARRGDGTTCPVELIASLVRDTEQRPICLIGSFLDVSDRKRAEERRASLAAMVEQSLTEVYVFDASTLRFIDVNRGARENLGYSLEEMRSLTPLDLKPLLDTDTFESLVEPLRKGLVPKVEFSTIHRRKDGTSYPVDVHLQLTAFEGRPAFVALILDTTRRRQLEEQLQQANKLESLGRLAGGLAHDFNNLLTAILGYAEMLKESVPQGSESADDVDQILHAGGRARELTSQLLAFARRQMIDPAPTDLGGLLDGMQRLTARLLGEDVELVCRVDGETWPVLADASQLEQVVLNLAVNARDAMPRGGRLTMTVGNRTVQAGDAAAQAGVAPGDYVQLAMTDTGVGMDHETLTHIFEPFFTTKAAGRGTGLGLATVYGIVKQNGGHILVDSGPGQGTTFRVILPRTTRPFGPRRREAPTVARTGVERVLLVEDDPGVRSLASRTLRQAGYEVLEAESGRAALDGPLLDAPALDLVVSDVVMPGMSGPELVSAIGSRYPGLKVLYITGYAESVVVHHGVAESGIDLLPKPFTSATFLRKVREVLDTAASPAQAGR